MNLNPLLMGQAIESQRYTLHAQQMELGLKISSGRCCSSIELKLETTSHPNIVILAKMKRLIEPALR